MSKYTPGPWEIVRIKHPDQSIRTGIHRPDQKHWIAKIADNTNRSYEEDQANACLISAAPEMLEALKLAEYAMDMNIHPNKGCEDLKSKILDLINKIERGMS